MFKRKHIVLPLVALILFLAACGGDTGGSGSGESAPVNVVGDAARGKLLYEQAVTGFRSAPGCIACHSLEPGVTLVGPTFAGLASRAAEIINSPNYTGEAKTVEAYLWESITKPNAFIEAGYPASVMYQNYEKDLSAQEISDIVAFLLTLQ